MEKLLKLLDQNARMSDAQLAVMLNTTEEDVKKQIAALEKQGVIRAYKAVIDWDKTDREYVTALIELHVTPKRDLGFEDIAQTIMKFKEVESISLMSGGYDFSITVNARTFKDVAMFVAKRLSPLESVVSTATHFVLRRYKENNVIFFEDEKDERGAL
ncbi:MAG: Lrp/AsnC family transcriptional regulator [Acutalibacteraceae bacterium]